MKSLAKGIPLVEMGSHLTQNSSEAGPRAYGRPYDQRFLGTLGEPIRRDFFYWPKVGNNPGGIVEATEGS